MSGDLFHILLVEDNPADVFLFRMALKTTDLKFELKVIDDGGAALAFVRNEGPDPVTDVPDLAQPSQFG